MVEQGKSEAIWREKRRPRAARIRQILRDAQQLIPIPHHVPDEFEEPPSIWGELTGTLDEFEMFFHYGEYELAWEAVTSVAQRTPPDPAAGRC